ncbi:MAG: P-loop NTPase fold protein [Chitinophagales bacterium]
MESEKIDTSSIQEIYQSIDENQLELAHNLLLKYVGSDSRFDREIGEISQLLNYISELKSKDNYDEAEKFESSARVSLRQLTNKIITYEKLNLADNFLYQEYYDGVFQSLRGASQGQPWNKEIDDLEKAYSALEGQNRNGTIDQKHFTKQTQPIKGRLQSIIDEQKAILDGNFSQDTNIGNSPGSKIEYTEATGTDTTTQTTYIPRYQSDGATGVDQLDILHEVDAFMQLVLSKKLEPPLSIGLLGNWGSGKSFFMNKLHQRIDLKSSTLLKEGSEQNDYCTNITQIQFNAWYYVDANLWASLVDKIFQSLGESVGLLSEEQKKEAKLYKQLASTEKLKERAEQSIEEIENKKTDLQNKLDLLEEDKKLKEETLETVKAKDVFNELMTDDKVKSFVSEAREKLDFGDSKGIKDTVIESLNDVNGLIDEYKSNKTKVREAFKYLLSIKKWRALLAMLVFLILPLIVIYVLYPYLDKWNTVVAGFETEQLLKIVTGVGSIVTAASLFIKKLITTTEPLFKKINEGVDYLNLAKQKLENLKKVATAKIDEEIEAVIIEIESIEEQELALQKKKAEAELDVDTIKREIEAIEAGKRFSSFLEQRIASEDYKKHLGIISIIREDFSKLTEYFQSNIEQITNDLKVERIILYIDDLDRCPPKKVVEVLQAIHLILAFPLFVVVVGVDVRWIYNSLIAEYGNMLHHINTPSGQSVNQISSSATPFDYLEKVFQIPFQIKSIDNAGKRIYISKLLEGDVEMAETPKNEAAKSNAVSTNSSSLNPKTETRTAENESETTTTATDMETIEAGTIVDIKPLKIEKEQLDFISYLAPIIGDSPRSIKRFINVARLVKSNPRWLPQYGQDQHLAFPCFLTLMAIIIGTPEMASFFLKCLEEDTISINLGELLTNNTPETNEDFETNQIVEQWNTLKDFVSDSWLEENEIVKSIFYFDITYIRTIEPTVSRFSFRTLA